MATLSTDAPITPLRQRMQQDMLMRGSGTAYAAGLRSSCPALRRVPWRAPDTATTEDIRRFQLHQHENGVGPATINGTVSALRFLFTVTLKRRDLARARGSNGGASLVRRLPQERRTGRTPHDPAWPSCSYDRATPAPVNGMLCAHCRGADRHAHQSRRNQRYDSATWPGSRFHDMPTASYAEVRDRRWHTPRHKSP